MMYILSFGLMIGFGVNAFVSSLTGEQPVEEFRMLHLFVKSPRPVSCKLLWIPRVLFVHSVEHFLTNALLESRRAEQSFRRAFVFFVDSLTYPFFFSFLFFFSFMTGRSIIFAVRRLLNIHCLERIAERRMPVIATFIMSAFAIFAFEARKSIFFSLKDFICFVVGGLGPGER